MSQYRQLQICIFLAIMSIILYTVWQRWNEIIPSINARTDEQRQHVPKIVNGGIAKIHIEDTAMPDQTENIQANPDKSTVHNRPSFPSNRYLLPFKARIMGGANHQYRRFKNAIIMSILTNRTFVMAPFFLHGGYSRGYTRESLRPFNSTFDTYILSKVVPLATIDDYKKTCNSNNTKVILWAGEMDGYDKSKTRVYADIIDLNLPSKDKIINLELTQLDKISSITRDEKCVALSIDGLFDIKVNYTEERRQLEDLVEKHLVRSPSVLRVVDDLTPKICHGRQCLVYHWRNATTETPCVFGIGNQKNECTSLRQLARKLGQLAAESVSNLMKSEKIECMYLACPLWSMEMVDILSKWIPKDNNFTSRDILRFTKDKTLLDDPYMFSLVEQEISSRAAVFVSTTGSNWSNFVTTNRRVNGRKSYNIREIAKVPEDAPRGILK